MSSADLESRLVTPGVRLCPADDKIYQVRRFFQYY